MENLWREVVRGGDPRGPRREGGPGGGRVIFKMNREFHPAVIFLQVGADLVVCTLRANALGGDKGKALIKNRALRSG